MLEELVVHTRLANLILADSLRGDKESILTHTYQYKSLRKIKVIICNHRADS